MAVTSQGETKFEISSKNNGNQCNEAFLLKPHNQGTTEMAQCSVQFNVTVQLATMQNQNISKWIVDENNSEFSNKISISACMQSGQTQNIKII